jgi:hypothetical protein
MAMVLQALSNARHNHNAGNPAENLGKFRTISKTNKNWCSLLGSLYHMRTRQIDISSSMIQKRGVSMAVLEGAGLAMHRGA